MKTGRNNVTMSQRRDIAANWEDVNPILASGEIGIEGTPTVDMDRMKIGDGITVWTMLPYVAATDLGANGIASPTLSSIVVLTEAEFAVLTPKDPTTAYFVLPNP